MASKIWFGLAFSVLLYFLFGPGPYQAQGFSQIKDKPDYQKYIKQQNPFQGMRLISHPNLQYPEDILVEGEYIYAGGYKGKLYRIDKHEIYSVVVQTKGQIMRILKEDEVFYFMDVEVGICKFDSSTGQLQVLVDSKDYKFLDSFAMAKDGKIYFTEASSKYTLEDHIYDIFEGNPYGKLLEFDPQTNKTRILIDDLYFANGVEVSPDGQTVYVAESLRFRVLAYHLKGSKAGTFEVMIDNLGGLPDNLRFNEQGELWIAFPLVRDAVFDYVLRTTFIRNLIGKIPWVLANLIGAIGKLTGGLKIDTNGKILEYIQGPTSKYPFVTTILEKDNKLYLGSIVHTDIGIIDRKN